MNVLKNRVTAVILSLVMVAGGVGIGLAKNFLNTDTAADTSNTAAVEVLSQEDYIDDEADVLSDSTESQIYEYNQQLAEEGGSIYVTTVDSLNGQAIADYSKDLFDDQNLDGRAFLLVLSTGDEDYYAAYGDDLVQYLGNGEMQNLLNDYLEDDFAAGDYDSGVAELTEAVESEMEIDLIDFSDGSATVSSEASGAGMIFPAILFVGASGVIYLVRRRPKAVKMQSPGSYSGGYGANPSSTNGTYYTSRPVNSGTAAPKTNYGKSYYSTPSDSAAGSTGRTSYRSSGSGQAQRK